MQEGDSKRKPVFWITLIILVGVASFAIGMFIFRQIGYDDGVRFAVTSGSKQAYTLGFEMGYQLRDSIAKKEKELRESNQFNLNIIEQEAATPEEHIVIAGSLTEKQVDKVGVKKFASMRIISTAQFARYKEMKINVKFMGTRNRILAELTISPDDILYPGRTVIYEIPYKDVPEFSESVEAKLVSALGID